MCRVNFVPDVPGKKSAAAAPSLSGKSQALLNSHTCIGTKQPLRTFVARAPVGLFVGMVHPATPHPKIIVRREKNTHAVLFAQCKNIIPEPYHIGLKATRRSFKVAVLT